MTRCEKLPAYWRKLLDGIVNQKVMHLAAQARALDAAELKGVGSEKRRAMLVCLIHRAKVGARDGLAEMLTKILGRIHNSRGREEFERVHRERRASTEVMMELLGKILAGTAAPLHALRASLSLHAINLSL